MSRPLVIFGTGSFAEVAHFMFSEDSDYEVQAFTVNERHIEDPEKQGLPVVPFESLETKYPPEKFELFVAVGYRNLNRLRASIFRQSKDRGYTLANYLSSKATLWSTEVGENCFIFEDNTIQPFVRIGNDTVLWSGNHVGHHSVIGSHCFIASHVVISGNCRIGDYCFLGVNATLRDSIEIADECIIGAGALVMSSTNPKEVLVPERTRTYSKTSDDVQL